MDKYLTVILVFMIIGIPIAFIEPTTGQIRDKPFYALFYASIGGMCVIILYTSYKNRQEQRKSNTRRRSK